MAFLETGFAKLGASLTSAAPSIWGFTSPTDTLATISASAYFDTTAGRITVGDLIVVKGTDAVDMLEVTSATVPVTTAGFISAASIPDGTLTGAKAAVVADANTVPGLMVMHTINTAGGATGNTDVVITDKIRVIDVLVQNNAAGTASDTVQVLNGASAITDAIDISGADTTVARNGQINDANATISALGTLRVTETDGGGADSPATTVTVKCVKVV